MSLSYARIIALATQTAKAPGFTVQAGELLNAILAELCQNYNFELAKVNYAFTFNGTSGPYLMPADYLRTKLDSLGFTIDGVPYKLVQLDYEEYLDLVQTPGLQSYPQFFATDASVSPVKLYVWPPPSGAYPVTMEYYSQMAEVASPSSSSAVPWFPNQTYLLRRLAGELMMLTGDQRANGFLGDNEETTPQGAGVILRKYIKMKDDEQGYVQRVTLDRRRFGTAWSSLRNTKTIGWVVLLAAVLGGNFLVGGNHDQRATIEAQCVHAGMETA